MNMQFGDILAGEASRPGKEQGKTIVDGFPACRMDIPKRRPPLCRNASA
jgi:hypothetical protein